MKQITDIDGIHIDYESLVNKPDIQSLTDDVDTIKDVLQIDEGSGSMRFTSLRAVFTAVYHSDGKTTINTNMAGIRWLDADGNDLSNIAGATKTVSDVYNNNAKYGCDKLYDNDPTTFWSNKPVTEVTETSAAWASITFTEQHTFAGVEFMPRALEATTQNNYGTPTAIRIEGSEHGTSWVTLAELSVPIDEWVFQDWKHFDIEQIPVPSSKIDTIEASIDELEARMDSFDRRIYDCMPEPSRIVVAKFYTTESMPTAKDEETPILAHGNIVLNIDGEEIACYATAEVQGKSSANLPKKNYTFAFYDDDAYTVAHPFRIGSLVPHSEYVFKANYIDGSQCRNIAANRLWESIIQTYTELPIRGNEGIMPVDSGALCHVEGYPCVIYINDAFYGIGDWTIGKKNANYDMDKANQHHIQMQAEPRTSFVQYTGKESLWEIRCPKTPDSNFASRVNQWFTDNARTGDDFKAHFGDCHVVKNAIDYWLFAEFLYAEDILDNNVMFTTWDAGNTVFMLPYDLDTTWGLAYNGQKVTPANQGSVIDTTIVSSGITTKDFWTKFTTAYSTEIRARFNELVALGVFSVANIARIVSKLQAPFGSYYTMEYAKWTSSPSKLTATYGQILTWTATRLKWMNAMYNPVPATAIEITSDTSITGEATLECTLTPSNTTDSVVWSITDGTEFATIDQSTGHVTVVAGTMSETVTIRATASSSTEIYDEKAFTVSNLSEYDISYIKDSLPGTESQYVNTHINLFDDTHTQWTLFTYFDYGKDSASGICSTACSCDSTTSPYPGFRVESTNVVPAILRMHDNNGSSGKCWYINAELGTVVYGSSTTAITYTEGCPKYPGLISRDGDSFYMSVDGVNWTCTHTAFVTTDDLKGKPFVLGGWINKSGVPARFATTDNRVAIALKLDVAQYPCADLVAEYSPTA